MTRPAEVEERFRFWLTEWQHTPPDEVPSAHVVDALHTFNEGVDAYDDSELRVHVKRSYTAWRDDASTVLPDETGIDARLLTRLLDQSRLAWWPSADGLLQLEDAFNAVANHPTGPPWPEGATMRLARLTSVIAATQGESPTGITLDSTPSMVTASETLLRAGVTCIAEHDGVIEVLRDVRPRFDEDLQLHNEDGPAWRFPNGLNLYYWHGTPIHEDVIERPDTVTGGGILGIQNMEMRRAAIEAIGEERLLSVFNAQVVDQDTDQHGNPRELYETEPIPLGGRRRERLKILVVTCPSTDRTYHLMVEPDLTHVHDAVAWTFGKEDPDRYAPLIET